MYQKLERMLEKEKIDFEKTVIVGVVTQNQSEEKLKEYLDELEFLTFTAGGRSANVTGTATGVYATASGGDSNFGIQTNVAPSATNYGRPRFYRSS